MSCKTGMRYRLTVYEVKPEVAPDHIARKNDGKSSTGSASCALSPEHTRGLEYEKREHSAETAVAVVKKYQLMQPGENLGRKTNRLEDDLKVKQLRWAENMTGIHTCSEVEKPVLMGGRKIPAAEMVSDSIGNAGDMGCDDLEVTSRRKEPNFA